MLHAPKNLKISITKQERKIIVVERLQIKLVKIIAAATDFRCEFLGVVFYLSKHNYLFHYYTPSSS